MSDLSAAAAAMGVPESLVRRSAEARAKATGATVEDVLAAWAGGGQPPAPAPAAASPAPTPPATGPASPPPPAPAVPEPPTPSVVAPEAAEGAAPIAVTPAPAPTEVSAQDAWRHPVVVTVPTSGLQERTAAAMPKWLAAAFLLVATFGLLQLAGATSNECGEGAELAADRVTGALVNCDGTPFTGRGEPGGEVDFFALGEQVYTGQVVPAANCAGCHGAQGQGGAGPAFATVVATFASCVDHVEWVGKGTIGFQAEGRTTYGDLDKPVGGVGNMPGFGASLTPEQIASAVAFERIRFGGADPDQTLVECGLVEGAEEGETGETPAPGDSVPTTAP